jgi:hypothetical protein
MFLPSPHVWLRVEVEKREKSERDFEKREVEKYRKEKFVYFLMVKNTLELKY